MSSPPRKQPTRSYNSGYESDDAFIRGREMSFDSASLSPDWDRKLVSGWVGGVGECW